MPPKWEKLSPNETKERRIKRYIARIKTQNARRNIVEQTDEVEPTGSEARALSPKHSHKKQPVRSTKNDSEGSSSTRTNKSTDQLVKSLKPCRVVLSPLERNTEVLQAIAQANVTPTSSQKPPNQPNSKINLRILLQIHPHLPLHIHQEDIHKIQSQLQYQTTSQTKRNHAILSQSIFPKRKEHTEVDP